MTDYNDKKIIKFPESKIVRHSVNDSEKIKESVQYGNLKYADSIIENQISDLIDYCESTGIKIEKGTSGYKDFSYLIDVLRSMTYRHFEIDHHLHEFLDNEVEIEEENPGETA